MFLTYDQMRAISLFKYKKISICNQCAENNLISKFFITEHLYVLCSKHNSELEEFIDGFIMVPENTLKIPAEDRFLNALE